MLTIEDRKWFIDPIQSPDLDSDRLLVFEERWERAVSNKGKIVKVKGYEQDGFRVWWLTEEGNYVYGAPVAPKDYPSYRNVVGWDTLNGVWFVGDSYSWSPEQNSMIVRNAIRSDAMRPDCPGGNNNTNVHSKDFVKAAPWARSLMPEARDSNAVIRAKVDLAEQKWKRRWAEAEILREASERGWDSDIKELNEDGKMPNPVFGAVVVGSGLIPMETAPVLTERDQERIAGFAAKGIATAVTATRRAMVPFPVKFAIDLQITGNETPPDFDTLRNTLRSRLSDHSVSLGDYSVNRYLTSVSA